MYNADTECRIIFHQTEKVKDESIDNVLGYFLGDLGTRQGRLDVLRYKYLGAWQHRRLSQSISPYDTWLHRAFFISIRQVQFPFLPEDIIICTDRHDRVRTLRSNSGNVHPQAHYQHHHLLRPLPPLWTLQDWRPRHTR